MSSANAACICWPNSRPRTTALTSSLSRKLRQSRLVDPTVDQTPSITAVFACSIAPARSYSLTPASSKLA